MSNFYDIPMCSDYFSKFCIEKIVKDIRGKNTFLKLDDIQLILVETNKGFSRGGHYHKTSTNHNLLSGKILLNQKNIFTGLEIEKTFDAPTQIQIIAFHAHVLTAITDTMLIEAFPGGYEDIVYPEYRKIVLEKMK